MTRDRKKWVSQFAKIRLKSKTCTAQKMSAVMVIVQTSFM
jgi:hypothetical protein